MSLILLLTALTAPPLAQIAPEVPAPSPEGSPAPPPLPPSPAPVAAPPPAAAPIATPAPIPSAPVPAPSTPVPNSASAENAARFALAAFAEGAIGFSDDGFYNQLAGLRLDYHPGDHLTLGLAASYANLKGKDGRAHNVLPAAMLEWRVPLSSKVSLPVRFFSGYLPHNGPWLKAALGLSHRIGEHSRVTFEALAPALWVVHDSTVGSFDAALEFAVDL